MRTTQRLPRWSIRLLLPVAALAAGSVIAAAPASAADLNIPWHDIHTTGCFANPGGYKGTTECNGWYRVNNRNYKFTQDNLHRCPVRGTLVNIDTFWWGTMLAGFTLHAR